MRDGIAFAFVWNDPGLVIYDVGNGIRGGSPSAPVEISRLVTATNGVCCGPSVHNGWWFHNPVTSERRYLFIGQEGAVEHRLQLQRGHPRRGRVRSGPAP